MRRALWLSCVLACVACPAHAAGSWVRAIPDQGDSQQVQIGSLQSSGEEWVVWTQSALVVRGDYPADLEVPAGAMSQALFAVRCLPVGIDARVTGSRLVADDGRVVYENYDPEALQRRFPPVRGMGYGSSTLALVCAAAVAARLGEPLEWPVPPERVRDLVRMHLPGD